MGPTTRIAAFAVAVALAFGGAWGAGRLVGPAAADRAADPAGSVEPAGSAEHAETGTHGEPGATEEAVPALPAGPAGLSSSGGGYRLVVDTPTLPAGGETGFRFRILGDGNAALTRFAVEHDKLMHLVLVRRDGTNYRHLHPELSADGTWSVPVALTEAGSYRAFADFRPEGGERTTLGIDIAVPGVFRPVATAPSDAFDVDGYTVRLGSEPGRVTATVTSGGDPVTDLQPYLGAYGHLVALRDGDLAFLHVHPEASGAGPDVSFGAEFPTPGRYRLFFDFAHDGAVRTAEFTLDVRA